MGNHSTKGGDVIVCRKSIERVKTVSQAKERNGKVDGGRVDRMAAPGISDWLHTSGTEMRCSPVVVEFT